MKRSFEEDVGEATARGTRQRRNDHGGWGVLSFFKHVPLLNKLVATNDDDDDEIEDIAVDKDDAPSPKRPTQQQPKSPLRRTSAATPTHENKRSFTFPRSTGDDEVKASASPAKPCFESNGDQGTNAFVFTRKSHNSTPNKQQKVFPSSVHDQAIDVSDFYTPGSFAPRHTSAKATEHVQPPTDDNTTVLPIQLFSDSSNPSRLSRGGLIKKITLSREERRQKRPVPSRLLANHSTNAREHSKMITERILATLSAMDADPLAKETQKPAPSLSMSWGKYHLDLVEQESAKESAELDLSVQQGVSRPPVNSLGSLLPKKSPVAQTLAVPVAAPKEPSATPVKRKVFLFGFSTPEPASGSVAIDADILLNKPVKYTFSKPNKVVPSKNATSVLPTKPYQFVSPPVQAPTIIRHASPPSASSLPSTTSTNPLDKFKIRKAGSWTCSACLVNNLDAKMTQCPSCETPKDASSSAPAATPATPSTNPLAKFMQHAPGSWACPSCKVRNGPSQSKCPCCETAKPGDDGTAVKKSSDSAPSFGFTKPAASSSSDKPAVALGVSSEDKPAFSFGVSSKESPIKVSFGVAASAPSATESKLAETPAATSGFSFGASAAASSAASEKPASGAFSFSLDAKSDKPTTSTDKPDQPAPCSDAPADKTGKPAFSFGAPADAKPAASDSAKPAFSFGAPALKPAPSTEMPAIAVDAPTDKPTTADKPTFVFGASNDKPAAPSDTPAFAFGSTTVKPVTSSDKPVVTAPTFAFGKPDATAVSGQNSSIGGPGAFSFTAPSTAAASETKAPSLGFGDSSTSATVSKDAAPTFTLEPKSKKRSVDGEGSSGPVKVGGDGIGSAGFGSTTATLGSSASLATFKTAPTASDKPSFATPSGTSFGAPAASSTFGAPSTTSDKPAFGATPAAPTSTATPAASTFVFGSSAPSSSSSTTPPKPTFGGTFGAPAPPTAPSTSFGFASSTGTFGVTAAAPAAPAFGATTTAVAPAPAFGATTFGTPATSSVSFGQSPPTTTSGFGSTFNFGSTAPPATTGAFGAAAPAAPTSFGGSAPTSSSSFGGPAPTSTSSFGGTFGAPAAPSAFGAPAPSTTGFGAAAPATFVAPAFGASQPTSIGGAPPAAATSGFSGSGGFGGFGQAAPITAAAGSFNMGVAEPKKAPSGRRIVRAKPTSRRQN
ncbi:hypothetical protein H310_01832 [Aphanomyces invadans]|uniref:RanBP2-type domain-containing protein n=1 Tax=Aphanomyces invadans TaxID=157072 RepID=A0A024ULT8_9STRA|nr:hypothetical protein H310_01832 [Aphanomyces invadans]ETW07269.1 hypothetical protein H310_01832 [Aphanomyces invadans]|eukprot:XP_008863362.1 hypothetical protein H310_01832 [Aphanomyces invadans]